MESDPRHRLNLSREEAQKRYLEGLTKPRDINPDTDPTPPCPWDYKNRVKEAVTKALRDKHITRGVTIAAHQTAPIVVVFLTRQANGSWRQSADCQVAYEDGMEPEELGRLMAEAVEQNIEKVRRGEIRG